MNVTPPPVVMTGSATRVSAVAARITGSVDPNGVRTRYHVEFGTTSAYGHSSPSFVVGSGSAGVPVAVSLTGLRPDTVYHYRLVAGSAAGTTVGDDRAFATTRGRGQAPRFSFALPRSVAARVALHGRLRVRFSCSRACATHFVVTVASARATRFAPVAVTLARGSGRISARGTGRVTLRFMPGVAGRLVSQRGIRLLVLGYAVAPGGAPSAPRVHRLVLS